jgi:uncharacterized protein (TIGR02246 family)
MSSETLRPHASQSDDEAAVRALYTQAMEVWNTGSGESFAAPFAQNGHLVAFDGTHFKSRDEIVAFPQPLFDTWLKGTRLVAAVESVRFLSPDVALMHVLGGTVRREKTQPAPERDSIQTLVALKRDGAWSLAALQNTRVRPMSRSARSACIWLLTDWLWKVLGPTA